MSAVRVKVIYIENSREEIVRITPRAQVEAEQRFHGMNAESGVQASYWMAWRSLHQAGKEGSDYDTWLDKIEDAETIQSLYETVEAALKAYSKDETIQAGQILALVKELDNNPLTRDANAMDPTTGETRSPNGSSPSVSEPVSASTT